MFKINEMRLHIRAMEEKRQKEKQEASAYTQYKRLSDMDPEAIRFRSKFGKEYLERRERILFDLDREYPDFRTRYSKEGSV